MTTPAAVDQPQTFAFSFTGKGGEYFRIWIVNLALTILTLGIYSAWAKVRRMQYFYRSTSVAGSTFDYHGDPIAILKGRLIAVGLLVAYKLGVGLNPVVAIALLIVLAIVFPWLLQRSLRFKLSNSSYRGLRFSFDGTLEGAYKAFLLWPVLGYISLGLLAPFAHQRVKLYQHGNSRFGMSCFGFHGGPGRFYAVYGMMVLMFLASLVLFAAIFMFLGGQEMISIFKSPGYGPNGKYMLIGMIFFMLMGFYLLAFLVIGPWFKARIQNLVWNATALGSHGFSSQVRARDLLVIYLTNFIGIVLTLGLFKPFADIRLAKYRLERMALLAEGSLDEFVADQSKAVSAVGEETAEVFDFDISF